MVDKIYHGSPVWRREPLRVLLIMGHPRDDSLVAALARAYEQSARAAGVQLRVLNLHLLEFDVHVRTANFSAQPCESDIQLARADLQWAQHVVIAYPLWWGAMPALLKGFLDRLLAPGFAFVERNNSPGFRGLLHGRSAHLLVTMDTPPLIYRWLLRSPGVTALRRDVLGFCGIAPCSVTLFGPVLHASLKRRQQWLACAAQLGAALPRTASRTTIGVRYIWSWLTALRLQFYPMSWLAYTLGALCAVAPGTLQLAAYWWGYVALFLLEAATVFSNDVVDRTSDQQNQNYGPFNGGSRVLIERRLTVTQLRSAAGIAVLAGVTAFLIAAAHAHLSAFMAITVLLVSSILCLGYTMPPLRLSYRTLGEIDVGITHGVLVLLIGWTLQGGAWHALLPWIIGLPLSLAIIPSIILANIPDRQADANVGKKTVAVRVGNYSAAVSAGIFVAAATVLGIILASLPTTHGLFTGIAIPTSLHALFVITLIVRYLWRGAPDGRCDGLIMAALTFMSWYLIFPVWHIWHVA